MQTADQIKCPDSPDPLGGDLIGCGRTFVGYVDDQGWADCPHCGVAFHVERERQAA